MSNLKETIEVACPTFYAMEHVERFFTRTSRDHTPGTLELRVDLSSLRLPGASQARHDVHVEHGMIDSEGKKQLALSWDPQDRTVPHFAGALTCDQRGPGTTILTLAGTYKPPLGVAGAAFDLVVGRKIAAASARALLEDIKQFIESDFQTRRATELASSPKD